MLSLTKNLQPLTKKCFSLQTTRLAKSFEPLNSSLALSVPELRSRSSAIGGEAMQLLRQPKYA